MTVDPVVPRSAVAGGQAAGSDDGADVGEAGDVGLDIAADEQQIGRVAGPDPPPAVTNPAGVGRGGGGGRERHRGGCERHRVGAPASM